MEEKKADEPFVRKATGLVRAIGARDAFAFKYLSMNLFGILVLMVFASFLYPEANLSFGLGPTW